MRGLRKRPLILFVRSEAIWGRKSPRNSSQKSTSSCWFTLKFSYWAKPQVFARMPPLVHLGVEQLRQRHPARLGVWPCGLAAWRLDPLAEMREERGGVLLITVSEEEGQTGGRQALSHLMQHPLGHRQGAGANLDHQQ